MKHGVWATAFTQIDATDGNIYYVREKIQDIMKMIPKDRSGSLRLTLSADLIQMIMYSPETVVIRVNSILGMSNVHPLLNFKYELEMARKCNNNEKKEPQPPPCEENWRYPL